MSEPASFVPDDLLARRRGSRFKKSKSGEKEMFFFRTVLKTFLENIYGQVGHEK